MNKRSRRKMSASQTLFWILSVFLVVSMVISLIIVALPGSPAPTLTPPPTLTPFPTLTAKPTATWVPFPSATPAPLPSPTVEPTEPPIGPVAPTASPAATAILPPVEPLPLGATPSATLTLTATPATAGLGITFAVCGDSHGNSTVYRRVREAVQSDGSQFLVHTGDLVNEGSEQLWQEFPGIMAGFALPFYPVPGNHDGLNGQLDGYLAHSGAPAAHYSFDRGTVHLTLADSHNGGIAAAEMAWLREDLSTTDQPVKMVFLHHPPFDPDGTDHIMAFGQEGFMALMAEQAVDYVFTGHIHAFAQGEHEGVVYTITGGAGQPLYSQGHPQAFHHYLRVRVEGEEVAIEVVKV